MVKVGLIGLGKRAQMFNLPILTQLEGQVEICGVTTKSGAVNEKLGIKAPAFTSAVEMVKQTNPDFVILSVPHTESFKVALDLVINVDTPILIDTPISLDLKQINILMANARDRGVKIGVIEDWPYLPLECFKRLLISEEEMGPLILAENDYRTYDYHGTAQLRSYFGKSLFPAIISQDGTNYMMPKCERKDGQIIENEVDSWRLTMVRFNNGSMMLNKYSSQYKKVPYRISNGIRVYCRNSTIISDCLLSQPFKASVVDSSGKTHYLALSKEYYKNTIVSLSTLLPSGKRVEWANPFDKMELDEAQIGVMYHVDGMLKYLNHAEDRLLHTIEDFYEDMKIFHGIVQ